jgi:hypothetical protein
VTANPAFDAKSKAVPGVVANPVAPLAAHGFRRIAQTKLAAAVMRAATAKSSIGSKRIMPTSDS